MSVLDNGKFDDQQVHMCYQNYQICYNQSVNQPFRHCLKVSTKWTWLLEEVWHYPLPSFVAFLCVIMATLTHS